MTVQGQATAPLAAKTVSVFAPGNGTRYVAQTMTFVADATATKLTFQDVSATSLNVALMLDNVRVNAQTP